MTSIGLTTVLFFAVIVASGKLTDTTQVPFTSSGVGQRLWIVESSPAGESLGIEADLMQWMLKRCWNEHAEIGSQMLELPIARDTRTGSVAVRDARLQCSKEGGGHFDSPETNRWVACYDVLTHAPLTLTVTCRKVVIDAIQVGTIGWDNGKVTVDAVGIDDTPHVAGGRLVAESPP